MFRPISKDYPVRFFAFACEGEKLDIEEISLGRFENLIEQGFAIKYERHTTFENGARQICLHVMNEYSPIEKE